MGSNQPYNSCISHEQWAPLQNSFFRDKTLTGSDAYVLCLHRLPAGSLSIAVSKIWHLKFLPQTTFVYWTLLHLMCWQNQAISPHWLCDNFPLMTHIRHEDSSSRSWYLCLYIISMTQVKRHKISGNWHAQHRHCLMKTYHTVSSINPGHSG